MTPPTSLALYRVLAHPRAEVFEAWRSPDLMSQWFSADGWSARVTSDFRVGGSYRIEMEDAEGNSHCQFGRYLSIEDGSGIRFTWTCHEIGVEDSVVTVTLEDHPEGTELRITHELPPDPQLVAMHEAGWIRCLGGLESLLEAMSPHHPGGEP